ncbi:MAG: pyrroline-5-carboxylate reductase [Candidatus Magasanikbacteria bacterium RIFCSPLOWO2_01_FULL_43_20b]|uniref:Pyrroline-5-carboxylate reductase n=1 Tax=Candidatus Magasanikbacteria bacterium RIFCSPLOWO2_12_FULL_43_12 TaxID=1798692 RepID=A0A1F6MQU2_9BACT|nr:MAG: pyrroline-5-carboxylate reductase [Candidatus Magasanikbacteria bacterium RIFCSPHIGHO2_02_FULL_44_13]OGH72650.1 MAG: pyrroline-5-carboxylate reductase [Candidatus Magasanikbacteria bacterium RIFCSPLOWO2_02_FULL_43_22]OGH73583.1 MAG: pyrroline-5-carboxylate reductase [Candidatus Magasanikbacteria bacterium RIFCSPLOWO2_01_FULL_43_20b]OGH74031.1 MAG: pyrroline-5-carboxylate reductase [Candidatus Magasanikbacteria bacterium RIFCSPLOWO2_12_FULL_43_12]
MKKTIGIIGAGNMGGAIYQILKQSRLVRRVFICDQHTNKISALKADNDSLSLADLLTRSDIIILAVKPQAFKDLADEIRVEIKNKLIVSVMAGVSTRIICKLLKAKKVARVMPNMPAQIGQGAIGWFANKQVIRTERLEVTKLLSALGLTIEFKKENLLDAVTAVSGSGPAYFFYLCEQLEAGAIKLGLDQKIAKLLVEQTFFGSAALLKDRNIGATKLCQAINSRKGTTAAAIGVLEKNKFAKIFERALLAAFRRARELSKLYE